MTALPTAIASPPVAGAIVVAFGWSWGVSPDWLGVVRMVMMVLGGLVVVAIVLVVAIAIISGVIGMIGNLRRKN